MASAGTPHTERALPPVNRLAILTLALVVMAGIYMAATAGSDASLTPAVVLASAAVVVLLVNVVIVSRITPFAWGRYFQVLRGGLLAYGTISAILLFVFVYDGTPGPQLLVLTWLLVLFAVDVPFLFAFSVARFQDPEQGL